MARFELSDHAEMQDITGPYLWRCYLIKFREPLIITGIMGGVVGSDALPAYCALFEGNESAVPLSIVGYGVINEVGVGQVIEMDPPLKVEPGKWYLLGQAGQDVPGSVPSLASVHRWDVPQMVDAEYILEDWHPIEKDSGTRGNQFYGYSWGGSPHPETILGENWNPDGPPLLDARPYVGFTYRSWDIWVHKSGIWQPVSDIWARKGGTWQLVLSVDVNKDGWKPI